MGDGQPAASGSERLSTAGALGAVLAGGGEMGALMRSVNWAETAVGPVDSWPQSLRTALSILLETGFPMYIAWGEDFTQFYNDGYRPILGSTKHPAAMGRSTRETFAEIWDIIGPMFEGVMRGTPTTVVDFLLPLDRHGFIEECYFIFSYSPIRQENGDVGGVLVTVTETTQRVIGERRLKTQHALAEQTRDARSAREACELAAAVLGNNPEDVIAAHVYLEQAGGAAELVAECGNVEQLLVSAGAGPGQVIRLPITKPGAVEPSGTLVAATSPRLMLDAAYKSYLAMIASQIGNAIAGAQALEDARARAEALAELDRAKTTFFNNVSHEFRTPLSLMLGPTEDALATPERALCGEDLVTVHRNELRLLKLVNTLLDFARIEAGRADASYEPTDLAALTADLASAFRSAIERAGLTLEVDCPPLPEDVHVDRGMWEKIVLNLLSNALKFTFEGSIRVELAWHGSHVELRVRDSGVGIAAHDLEHVFERFHRITESRARTHEGSGIGLALVRELVGMHAGSIHAESELDEGTTFVVRVPTGSAHLPCERRSAEQSLASTALGATPYVEEALRWLPSNDVGAPPVATPDPDAPRVLVVDDNADMRDYIARLLAGRYTVETQPDGLAALASLKRQRPDVVISDVMMPGLDGFGLLARIRADLDTASLPVILLSARAGEEARIEGLNAGADDYLVKPFSARELLARVQGQVMRSELRSIEQEHARRLASVFTHAPMGVAILRGPDHVFEFANDRYLALAGVQSVVGKSLREALPTVDAQGIIGLLDEVRASGKPHVGRSLPLELQDEKGGTRDAFFDFVYQPLFAEGGQVVGIAVVAHDVTELAQARRVAESASQAKDEFLAMLGHELRNPLAPISTALHLLRLRGVGGERELAVIERQVSHMVSLVDDLMDVSRITRGKVKLERQPVDLADVVAKAIEMTSPAIEERRHVLRVDVARGLIVAGDDGRLAQVVANLLTNAAKYTDANGTIDVSTRVSNEHAVLSVKDNGSGIAPEMVPRVFDLFTQERQAIDRSRGGLGLGLAIVKTLVTAHGGQVEARSEGKGHGSEFIVRLPLTQPMNALTSAPSRPPEPQLVAVAGLKILVVDDNQDAAELLAATLRAAGHDTAVAYDAPNALALAARLVPDVALLDLGLPVMDGYELARRLRDRAELRGVKLVAITGYGQATDRQRSEEAGFDAHLVKPVDPLALEQWLRERVSMPPEAMPSNARSDG